MKTSSSRFSAQDVLEHRLVQREVGDQPDPQQELRLRLKELAAARVRYGYRRLHVLLRREGWPVNHKRIYRLYRLDGLVIRQKTPRRKRSSRYRGERLDVTGPNQTWAMAFISDTLFDGRPIRVLTVVDCHTRESLAIEPLVLPQSFGPKPSIQPSLPKEVRKKSWLLGRAGRNQLGKVSGLNS